MDSNLDDAFRALAHPLRRQLLIAIDARNPQPDRPLEYPEGLPLGPMEHDHARVEMYHKHLPMLEAAGVIEWHSNYQEITKGPNFDAVRPFLGCLDEDAVVSDVSNGV